MHHRDAEHRQVLVTGPADPQQRSQASSPRAADAPHGAGGAAAFRAEAVDQADLARQSGQLEEKLLTQAAGRPPRRVELTASSRRATSRPRTRSAGTACRPGCLDISLTCQAWRLASQPTFDRAPFVSALSLGSVCSAHTLNASRLTSTFRLGPQRLAPLREKRRR